MRPAERTDRDMLEYPRRAVCDFPTTAIESKSKKIIRYIAVTTSTHAAGTPNLRNEAVRVLMGVVEANSISAAVAASDRATALHALPIASAGIVSAGPATSTDTAVDVAATTMNIIGIASIFRTCTHGTPARRDEANTARSTIGAAGHGGRSTAQRSNPPHNATFCATDRVRHRLFQATASSGDAIT